MRIEMKMLSIVFICAIMFVCASDSMAHVELEEEVHYVLLVFSGAYSEPINELRLDYIESALEQEHIHYEVVFLDASFQTLDMTWQDYMAHRWIEYHPYDVIVAYDEVALTFISENEFFDGIPLVFSGIDDVAYAESFNETDHIRGSYDVMDFSGTLSIATELMDEYEDIYLLTDETKRGQVGVQQAEEVMKVLGYEYDVINMSKMSSDAYTNRLSQIGSNDIVILISNNMSDMGITFTHYEMFHILAENLRPPVFTVDEIGIGYGALGGSVISYELEAANIMTLVETFFQGTDVSDLPVRMNETVYKFDYEQLVHHDLVISNVPKDAVLINEPEFYNDRVTILAIVLLSVFIMVLLIAVIGLFYRITNEKKLALAAVKSKSEFLAKMSHEVRTPTNAIIGYTQLLKKSIHDATEVTRKVALIEESSKSLLNIINDILDYSMIEEGKLSIEPKGTEFLKMFENVTNTAEILIGDKDVKFVLDLDRNIPKYLEIDDKRMEQVFVNLLSNSVKFTKQGEIKLSVQLLSQTGNQVKLKWEIQDTGKGMAADNMDKVFRAFQQEDNSISREYGGTGLGLFITKEIITSMEGRIYVESSLGKGTRFVILTSHKVVDEERMYDQREHKHHGLDYSNSQEKLERRNIGRHILVAEDNEVNQMLMQEMLEMMGLEMTIVRNGLEAVAFAREEQCDLILMDVHMPIMNGVDATDRIKEIEAYKHIPIIGLTADVIREHMSEYKKHGFEDILTKPVYMEELIRALNKYL